MPVAVGVGEGFARVVFSVAVGVRKSASLVLTGTGDVLEPEDGLIGIGSGGMYALSAARALISQDGMDAETIARRAMEIAAGVCVYTNTNIIVEKL